jgi:pyrophosphatase PpaX
LTLEDCYRLLVPNSSDEFIQDLSNAHRNYQINNPETIPLFPGVKKELTKAKKFGLKLGVVTTRRSESTLAILEDVKIAKLMDVVIGREGVRPKPSPEPVLEALKRLDVKPQNAVMVGDTDVDILAGKAAGTLTIGVRSGFRGERIAESSPDYVIDSVADILPTLFIEMRIFAGAWFE